MSLSPISSRKEISSSSSNLSQIEEPSKLLQFTSEILIEILRHLNVKDFPSVSLSCKRLQQIIDKKDQLWKLLFTRDFGKEISQELSFKTRYQERHSILQNIRTRNYTGKTIQVQNATISLTDKYAFPFVTSERKVLALRSGSGLSYCLVYTTEQETISLLCTFQLEDSSSPPIGTIGQGGRLCFFVEFSPSVCIFYEERSKKITTLDFSNPGNPKTSSICFTKPLCSVKKLSDEQIICGFFGGSVEIWDLSPDKDPSYLYEIDITRGKQVNEKEVSVLLSLTEHYLIVITSEIIKIWNRNALQSSCVFTYCQKCFPITFFETSRQEIIFSSQEVKGNPFYIRILNTPTSEISTLAEGVLQQIEETPQGHLIIRRQKKETAHLDIWDLSRSVAIFSQQVSTAPFLLSSRGLLFFIDKTEEKTKLNVIDLNQEFLPRAVTYDFDYDLPLQFVEHPLFPEIIAFSNHKGFHIFDLTHKRLEQLKDKCVFSCDHPLTNLRTTPQGFVAILHKRTRMNMHIPVDVFSLETKLINYDFSFDKNEFILRVIDLCEDMSFKSFSDTHYVDKLFSLLQQLQRYIDTKKIRIEADYLPSLLAPPPKTRQTSPKKATFSKDNYLKLQNRFSQQLIESLRSLIGQPLKRQKTV